MQSMETGFSLKRVSLLRSSSSSAGRPFFQPRSRIARFLLFEKVDYLQWICTVSAFFFVAILIQSFLPGSISDQSTIQNSFDVDRTPLKSNFGELDFGEGIRFMPKKLLERFEMERKEKDSFLKELRGPMRRAGLRKPRLAVVVDGLLPDAMQLQMVSIAVALMEIGYDIEAKKRKKNETIFEDDEEEEMQATKQSEPLWAQSSTPQDFTLVARMERL